MLSRQKMTGENAHKRFACGSFLKVLFAYSKAFHQVKEIQIQNAEESCPCCYGAYHSLLQRLRDDCALAPLL